MAFVILDSLDRIYEKLDLEKGGKTQKFFTSTCRNHMNKYVPYRDGPLSKVVTETAESITYEMPYATYQYEGVSVKGNPLNYRTDIHPLAGSYWDKKMMTAEMNDVIREVQEFYDRGAK